MVANMVAKLEQEILEFEIWVRAEQTKNAAAQINIEKTISGRIAGKTDKNRA